jgi:hypothetical protein
VRENQVIPAVQRDQPIARSEIDSGLPFGCADLILDAGCRLNGRYAHGYDLWLFLCMRETAMVFMDKKPV